MKQQQKLSMVAFLLAYAIVMVLVPLVFSAGEWQPIQDLNDPHVKEIAEFAVSEYNKQQSKAALELKSVVKGEEQAVAGINYKLDLLTSDSKQYEAVVWERSAPSFSKQLISFKSL